MFAFRDPVERKRTGAALEVAERLLAKHIDDGSAGPQAGHA